MLAYVSWHRPAPGVALEAYEAALERFHRSLAARPPAGFCRSTSLRAPELPWLADGRGATDGPGYEDWYLIEDWTAVGVLEQAAVGRGHQTAHERIAGMSARATSAFYRLVEGCADLARVRMALWVERAPGHEHPSLESLLGDGLDPDVGSLWRRSLGLGPAPEFCMLAADAPVGAAAARLPAGWSTTESAREVLWSGGSGQ